MAPSPVRVSEADRVTGVQHYVAQMYGQRIGPQQAARLSTVLRGEPKQDAAIRSIGNES